MLGSRARFLEQARASAFLTALPPISLHKSLCGTTASRAPNPHRGEILPSPPTPGQLLS